MATSTLHSVPAEASTSAPFEFATADDGAVLLQEAHALLRVLSASFANSEMLGEGVKLKDGTLDENVLANLRDGIKANALQGVARLVELASYCHSRPR